MDRPYFVPPKPFRPGHVQAAQTQQPRAPAQAASPVAQPRTARPRPVYQQAPARPRLDTFQPAAQVRQPFAAATAIEANKVAPVRRGGCGLASGCLIAAIAVCVLGGVGVGAWQLAKHLQHHAGSSASIIPATGDVNNNTFGPIIGTNGTVAVVTITNGTNTTTVPSYSPPVPCAVSFVGTGGGNISNCISTPESAMFNPYVEPQAVTGALYQPIALTPVHLYPTGGVPTLSDVVEHHMEVCYEAAVMAAMVARLGGAQNVSNALFQTSSGAVPTYNVTLYSPGPDRSPINISVSGLQMTKANTEVLETSGTHDLHAIDPQGNWATFFEKAFVKYNDVYRSGVTGRVGGGLMGYNGIGEGGSPGDVIEAMIGRPSAFFDVASDASLVADTMAKFFVDKKNAGDIITLTTDRGMNFTAGNDAASYKAAPFTCTTVASHTYVALDFDIAARLATIHNVWGTNPCFTSKGASSYQTNGTVVMSFDDMKRSFLQAVFSVSNQAPATKPGA